MKEKNLPPEPRDMPVYIDLRKNERLEPNTFIKIPVPDMIEHNATTSDRVWQTTRHFCIGAAGGVGTMVTGLAALAPQLLIQPVTWITTGVVAGIVGGFEARRKFVADRKRGQGTVEKDVPPRWWVPVLKIIVDAIVRVIEARKAKE